MLRAYYNGDNSYSPSSSALVPQTVTAGVSLGFHAALEQTMTAPDFTLAIGDFNGDGIGDLATANYYTGDLSIFLGNGDGTFRAVGTIPVDSPNAVLVADFNGDGKADLAISNNYNGTVSILLGNGDGTFAGPVPYNVGSNPWYLAIGDFNGDGRADLVVANVGGNGNLSVLLGNGDGTFAPAVDYQLSASPSFVATGDFRGDGKVDLAAATETGVSILLGHGDGTFADPVDYPVGYLGPIVVHDFNGDGIADITAVNNAVTGGMLALLGNGDGTFQSPIASPSEFPFESLAVEDFNGDGIPDLAVADRLGLGILLGNGDGSFQPITHYQAGSDNEFLAVGDVNGDDFPDVVLIDRNTWGFLTFLGGAGPDLTLSAGRFGGLTQGQMGAAYSIVIGNSGVISSAGAVQVTVSLPAGFTLTGLSGNGWLCNTSTVACTRSDPLSANGNYPAITLTFNVSNSLAGRVTSTFSITGGGSQSAQVTDNVLIRAATVTVLRCTPNPAPLGQAVTLTATVTTGATGTVTFFDGATPIGSAPSTSGQAVFSTSLLPSGSQPLYATYSGDANFGPSSSRTQLEIISAVQANSLWTSASNATGADTLWVVPGDFNGDGIPDLIAASSDNNGSISVLIGKGDGTFAPAVTYTVPDLPNSLLTADFNRDGKLDLAIGSTNGVDILPGNGDGTFASPIKLSPGSSFPYLVSADFNGDGIPDLVAVSGAQGGFPALFLGNGDGTFQPFVNLTAAGAGVAYIAAADVNHDGNTDLIILAPGTGTVGVLPGNGNGTFGPIVTTSVAASQTDILAVGDFNGDGNVDVAVVSWNGIQALLGQGDGTFQAPIHSALTVVSSSFAIAGDFNGDGKVDIGYTGYSESHIHLAFGNGDGTFQPGVALATDSPPDNIVLADFNRDGTPDFAVSNYSGTVNVILGGQPPSLSIFSSHSGNFTIGLTGSYTITVENPSPQNTNGMATVSDTLPSGFTATAIGGNGWSCALNSLVCTLAESIGPGASYPPIVIAVHVAATLGASTVTNQVSVSYNGTLTSASDPTNVVIATTTSLEVSPNPSNFGQIATLTASVLPAVTGTVSFSSEGTFLGSAPVQGGQAVLRTGLLPAGRQVLTANYGGNSSYAKSQAAGQVQVVKAGIAGELGPPAPFSAGMGAAAIALGDFNGDGRIDLVIANSQVSSISVLLGNGDGTFEAPATYQVGNSPSAVAVGDFNNDGISDLAVGDISGNVSVLLGNGNGTFRPALAFQATGAPNAIVVADFNGDGNADLAVSGGGTVFLFGNGDGTFQAAVSPVSTNAASNIVAGDFNNDGIADLAYAYQGYRLYVVLGNGDGTFRSGIYSSGASSSGIAAGDLNGDGNTDIVGPDPTGIDVYLGNGDGTFQPYVHYAVANSVRLVILADVNGDGHLDVIGIDNTGYETPVSVLLGNGDGTFGPPFSYPTAKEPRGVVAADFNGDGRTDLAMSDYYTGGASVLLGTLTSVLSITSSHAGLFAAGQTGAAYYLTVSNGGPHVTSGVVTVTDTLPAGFTATAISGTGWSCILATLSCTRGDSLGVSASYPVITLIVTVPTQEPVGLVYNQVTVSGGGAAPASGSDQTGIQVGEPVTIQTIPSGLAFSIDGGPPQIAPQTINITQETHTIAVASTQAGAPGVQDVFTSWSDGGAASHAIYIEPSPATFTATFQTQYQLNLIANPAPGGTIMPATGAFFSPGSTVAVTATPTSPYIFDSWSGGITNTSNQVSVTMNGPMSITATFSVPGFSCDIDNQGSTNVVDVQAIINQALGVAAPNNDMNRDGVVNVADVQKVIDAAIGMGCIY